MWVRDPGTWLTQAESDFKAARLQKTACYRHYLLQQSCEKALKAIAVQETESSSTFRALSSSIGPTEAEKLFRSQFLRKHSPLSEARRLQSSTDELPTKLGANTTAAFRFFKSLHIRLFDTATSSGHLAALKKIDSAAGSIDPTVPSFRYPFFLFGTQQKHTSPAEFEGWEAYQGGARTVEKAVQKLLTSVRDELHGASR